MHELSLCRDLLMLVEQAVSSQQYEQILNVNVEIGPFANIEISALEFSFSAAKENTPASHAQLVIHSVDALGECPTCENKQIMKEYFEACDKCEYFPIKLIQGHEMRLKSVEVQ